MQIERTNVTAAMTELLFIHIRCLILHFFCSKAQSTMTYVKEHSAVLCIHIFVLAPGLKMMCSCPLFFSRSVRNDCGHFKRSHICHCPNVVHMQRARRSGRPTRMENVSLTGKPHCRSENFMFKR